MTNALISFDPNDVQRCLNIAIVDDLVIEPPFPEFFSVVLSNNPDPSGVAIQEPSIAVVNIVDNDVGKFVFMLTKLHCSSVTCKCAIFPQITTD